MPDTTNTGAAQAPVKRARRKAIPSPADADALFVHDGQQLAGLVVGSDAESWFAFLPDGGLHGVFSTKAQAAKALPLLTADDDVGVITR